MQLGKAHREGRVRLAFQLVALQTPYVFDRQDRKQNDFTFVC